MKKIDNEELKNINGGSIGLGLIIGLGTLITFIFGFIDGYSRPLACRK